MFGTECDTILSSLDTANQRTLDGQAVEYNEELVEAHLLGDTADTRQHTLLLQAGQCGHDVVVYGDGVDDEVARVREGLERLGVAGHAHFVGALLLAEVHLVLGACEGDHLVAHGLGELEAHGPEAADSDDAHLLLLAVEAAVVDERRPHGDARAQDGRDVRVRDPVGDFDGLVLVDHVALALAAERLHLLVARHAAVHPGAVLSAGQAFHALLLVAVLAMAAVSARVYDAAYANFVSHFELADFCANFHYCPLDFMSTYEWLPTAAPLTQA